MTAPLVEGVVEGMSSLAGKQGGLEMDALKEEEEEVDATCDEE